MEDFYSRTEMLIGKDALEKLKNTHVAVFGIGGVGSYTVEALARSGIGELTLIDSDDVSPSNLNRQIIATLDTVGMPKTDVAKKRILSINPSCKVNAIKLFFSPETAEQIDFSAFDYVCDAIDSVAGKLMIAEKCTSLSIPLISSMGTGNKLDPGKFEITDISKTSVCPLARVMRRELRSRGINHLKVLYSKEEPHSDYHDEHPEERRSLPASISFVPSCAGLMIAGEIIRDIIKEVL